MPIVDLLPHFPDGIVVSKLSGYNETKYLIIDITAVNFVHLQSLSGESVINICRYPCT